MPREYYESGMERREYEVQNGMPMSPRSSRSPRLAGRGLTAYPDGYAPPGAQPGYAYHHHERMSYANNHAAGGRGNTSRGREAGVGRASGRGTSRGHRTSRPSHTSSLKPAHRHKKCHTCRRGDGTHAGSCKHRHHHHHHHHHRRGHKSHTSGTTRTGAFSSITNVTDKSPNKAALVIALLLALAAIAFIGVGIWLLVSSLGWPVGLNFSSNADWTRTLSVGLLIFLIGLFLLIVVVLGFMLLRGATPVLRAIAVFLSAIVFTLLFVLAILCIIFASVTGGAAADFIETGWEKTRDTIPNRLCDYQRDNECYGFEDNSCRGCDVTADGEYTSGCTTQQRRVCPICVAGNNRRRTLLLDLDGPGFSSEPRLMHRLWDSERLAVPPLPTHRATVRGVVSGIKRLLRNSWNLVGERFASESRKMTRSIVFISEEGRPTTDVIQVERTGDVEKPQPSIPPHEPDPCADGSCKGGSGCAPCHGDGCKPCAALCKPCVDLECKKNCDGFPCVPCEGTDHCVLCGVGVVDEDGDDKDTDEDADENGGESENENGGVVEGAGLFTQFAGHGCKREIENDFRQFFIPFAVFTFFCLILVFLEFVFLCCVAK